MKIEITVPAEHYGQAVEKAAQQLDQYAFLSLYLAIYAFLRHNKICHWCKHTLTAGDDNKTNFHTKINA
jgi:hypothetical protein